MSKFFHGPATLFGALAALAALGWFMSTQSPAGHIPAHLQASATPGPAKFQTAQFRGRAMPAADVAIAGDVTK